MNRREFVKGSVVVGGAAGMPSAVLDPTTDGSGGQGREHDTHVGTVVFKGSFTDWLDALRKIADDRDAYNAFQSDPKSILRDHFSFSPDLTELEVPTTDLPTQDQIRRFIDRVDDIEQEFLRAHWHMGTVVDLLTAGAGGV